MAFQDDLQTLAGFGIFDQASVSRLAHLIRLTEALASGAPAAGRPRGRPPGGRGPGRPPGRGPGRPAGAKRAPRGTFNPTKEELSKMRQDGMTAKAIADKHGVSLGTVNLRLKQFGLTSSKRGRPPGKKK